MPINTKRILICWLAASLGTNAYAMSNFQHDVTSEESLLQQAIRRGELNLVALLITKEPVTQELVNFADVLRTRPNGVDPYLKTEIWKILSRNAPCHDTSRNNKKRMAKL